MLSDWCEFEQSTGRTSCLTINSWTSLHTIMDAMEYLVQLPKCGALEWQVKIRSSKIPPPTTNHCSFSGRRLMPRNGPDPFAKTLPRSEWNWRLQEYVVSHTASKAQAIPIQVTSSVKCLGLTSVPRPSNCWLRFLCQEPSLVYPPLPVWGAKLGD